MLISSFYRSWHLRWIFLFLAYVSTAAGSLVPIPGRCFSSSSWTSHIMTHIWNVQAPCFYPTAPLDEGCDSTMGVVEAALTKFIEALPDHAAKRHGSMPLADFGQWRLNRSRVQKRSFLRAARRARTNGFCWYHGRCLLPMDFAHVPDTSLSTTSTSQRLTPQHVPTKRLKIFTWNAGGLSTSRYWELLRWLELQSIDLVVLQESRWGIDAEWQLPHWHVIHSAGPKARSAGLLVMVAKTFCKQSQIRLADILPGRLLHIRLESSRRSIDVVVGYQYVDDNPKREGLLFGVAWIGSCMLCQRGTR